MKKRKYLDILISMQFTVSKTIRKFKREQNKLNKKKQKKKET